MTTLEQKVSDAVADGRMTEHDADEVHTFASFLRAITGLPRRAADRTREQQRAFITAYREHYPADYERAVAEQRAQAAADQPTTRGEHR